MDEGFAMCSVYENGKSVCRKTGVYEGYENGKSVGMGFALCSV